MEARLGVRLINRTTRSLHLTDEGASYHEACSRFLAEIEEADAAASARRVEPQGALKVALPASFGHQHVAPLIPKFATLYPKVRENGPGDIFTLEDLGSAEEQITIILSAREQDQEKASTILSLTIKRLQHLLFERVKYRDEELRPVLLLLDETRRIRAFDANKYITYAREAKAGCVVVYQSLDQIGDGQKIAEVHKAFVNVLRDHFRIVQSGRLLVAQLFGGVSGGATPGKVTHIAVGTNGTAAADDQTGLLAERAPRKPVANPTYTPFTEDGVARIRVGLTTTFDFNEANGPDALQEAGLFTADTGGVLYNRVTFDPVTKTNAFKLTLLWEVVF